MHYRKEIDGLRAIAVLPVILFHANINGFGGGYVGVDIFFVISGYLITSIIINEKQQGVFSFSNFYERRARRILPALMAVLTFSSIMAFITMPADQLIIYSQSLLSVVTFSSNIFFYITNNYFSTATQEQVLIHTWSLAIEEQYYIFFPIIIVALWSSGKKQITYVISGLALASLAWSQYQAQIGSVNSNFYLIFSRAWELLLGSLIVILNISQLKIRQPQRETLGIIGLALIFYSIIFFDHNTPFPSLYTLAPTMGAVLIISFSNNTYIGKLLSLRPLVVIGLISYSLYLWHQPIFAFMRLKLIGQPSLLTFMFAIALIFVIAYLSYKYIEKPFRSKTRYSRFSIFCHSVITITIFSAIGVSGLIYKGFEGRFNQLIESKTVSFSPLRVSCHTKGIDYLKPADACRYSGTNITWAAFGDSHIVEPAYALSETLRPYDHGLIHLTFSGCPPALLFNALKPGCSNWVKESVSYLENSESIHNVLLGFRYSAFLYGDQLEAYPEAPNEGPHSKVIKSYRNHTSSEIRELYWESLHTIINRLMAAGKSVYLVFPIPELPAHISKAMIPLSIFTQTPLLDLNKSTSAKYYISRNNFILNKLSSLNYGNNLYSIEPFEILCDGEYCPAVINRDALYFDDDHLSVIGATRLIENSVITDHLIDQYSSASNHVER